MTVSFRDSRGRLNTGDHGKRTGRDCIQAMPPKACGTGSLRSERASALISLEEALAGYNQFDEGAARKFVIDPNGMLGKKAA